jgi:predicted transcriptional regulator
VTTDGTKGHTRGPLTPDSDGGLWAPGDVLVADFAPGPCLLSLVERRANAALLSLAESAPHDCGDESCPGAQYRQAFEAMRKALTPLVNMGDLSIYTAICRSLKPHEAVAFGAAVQSARTALTLANKAETKRDRSVG